MAYQALYRVWRSQRFDEIVGQQMITQTLKNAIVQHKTSHAYLFTGPRGTGKTSAAKIFSKAINCHNSQDGEPCNTCENCQAITEGRLNDVIEIDAASNNGVDEIRDLREKVKYAPTQADYKVYIIDEVHMLSTGAFNALLKTLEEPPKNVLFILATTEPHKIPLTIISRTQRFDFKRITTLDTVTHMANILEKMGIVFDEKALYVVARAAEGGMRDALSILDQTLSFGDETITLDDALQVTGSLTYEKMDQFISACFDNETEQALKLLKELLDEGKEGSRLLEDLLLYCRDLLMQQQAPGLLLEQSGQVTENFVALAKKIPAETIYQYITLLSETQNEIRFTNHPNIYLEVVTVKLSAKIKIAQKELLTQTDVVTSSSEMETDINQLKVRLKQLEKELKQLKEAGVSGETISKVAPRVPEKQSSFRLPTERVYQVLRLATRERLMQVKDVWDDLLQMLSVTQRALLKACDPVAASDDGIVLTFEYEIVCQRASDDEDLHLKVKENLIKLIQYEPDLVCIPTDSWAGLRKDFLSQHQNQPQTKETSEVADELQLDIPPEENEMAVVEQAVELFGSVVEVVDD